MKTELSGAAFGRLMLLVVGAAALGCGAAPKPTDGGVDAVMERAKESGAAGAPGKDAAVESLETADASADVATSEAGAGDAAVSEGGDAAASEGGADGGASDASSDAASDVFIGTITRVGTFGCFARSGDGNDFFADGTPAAIVTTSPWRAACDLSWIGLDSNGFTKPTLPSTETITRRFVIDSLISDRATFTVSFEADDAAEIVLNGKSIAACTPPAGNVGECQQRCHVVTLAKEDFKPVGEENRLEMKMINLANTPTAGGKTGYTGISYSICATGE